MADKALERGKVLALANAACQQNNAIGMAWGQTNDRGFRRGDVGSLGVVVEGDAI